MLKEITVTFLKDAKDDSKENREEITRLVGLVSSLTTKSVEHDKDISSIQNEVIEHKSDNKEQFIRIENLFAENTKNNREDHGKIFDKVDKVSDQLTNATRIFLKNPNI